MQRRRLPRQAHRTKVEICCRPDGQPEAIGCQAFRPAASCGQPGEAGRQRESSWCEGNAEVDKKDEFIASVAD